MDVLAKAMVESQWDFLSEYQWRWEFMRRSDLFKKDTRSYIETNGRNKLFLAIWDLPHPDENCLGLYAYLQDYRTLLTDITEGWTVRQAEPAKLKKNLRQFAKALNGDGVFYKAHHPLVVRISPCGISSGQAAVEKWIHYMETIIILPPPLKDKWRYIISKIEAAGLVPFEYEIKPYPVGVGPVRLGGGTYSLRRVDSSNYATSTTFEYDKWLMDCSRCTVKMAIPSAMQSCDAEQGLSKSIQDVLSHGLEPVKFCQRRRNANKALETYTRQLDAFDVHRRVMNKREFMDRHATNDDGFKNYLKGAWEKVERLEADATSRRGLLGGS